jgi:SAM-dependent methyltransferase
MHNFDFVRGLLQNYEQAAIDQRISPHDAMNNQWYFQVGRSAVQNIALACLSSQLHAVTHVLDLPCGHGRVLRHLVRLFPGAEVHACDLDRDGVQFCAETFGAKPINSREELTEVDFGARFDVIWVGSLFTHVAHEVAQRWLAHLVKFLKPQGIVVATLHGRWSQSVHKTAPYIEEQQWQGILQDFAASGYGYRDYSQQESHAYISGSYGISLSKPHVIIRDIENLPNVRIYLYRERGFADHQDVVVFGAPGYDQPWA